LSNNRSGEDKDKIIEFLKSEYDLARHEWEYYTELFNRQDNLYSIHFAIFAVIIGAIYYIIQVNNKDTLFDNITLLHNQKMIICGLIIFLAVTYIYIYYYDGEFILFNYI
jgi:multisubunit Na+/H+ antiporter MnhF subunit